MLSSISWSQFLTVVIILLVIYYSVLISRFYRKKIIRLFSARPLTDGFHLNDEQAEPLFSDHNEKTERLNDGLSRNPEVHELLNDLKYLLIAAARANTIKEELMMALQLLLRDYPVLKNQPIQKEINQHLIAECKTTCSITLSDADTNMLWNG